MVSRRENVDWCPGLTWNESPSHNSALASPVSWPPYRGPLFWGNWSWNAKTKVLLILLPFLLSFLLPLLPQMVLEHPLCARPCAHPRLCNEVRMNKARGRWHQCNKNATLWFYGFLWFVKPFRSNPTCWVCLFCRWNLGSKKSHDIQLVSHRAEIHPQALILWAQCSFNDWYY